MRRIILAFVLLSVCLVRAEEFVWFDGSRAVTYALDRPAAPVVSVALDLLRSDLQQVTGFVPVETPISQATLRIVELDRASAVMWKRLRKAGIAVDELAKHPDGFQLAVRSGQLWVVGSNGGPTHTARRRCRFRDFPEPLCGLSGHFPQRRGLVAATVELADF